MTYWGDLQGDRIKSLLRIITLAIICILAFSSCYSENRMIGLGESLPIFRAIDCQGNEISSSLFKNNYFLMLFIGTPNFENRRILSYASVLQDKYYQAGLRVLAIADVPLEKAKRLSQQTGVNFPVVPDKRGSIHRLFHVNNCCGGIAIANRKGELEFFLAKATLDPDNLRQIVEKTILGKIPYGTSNPPEQDYFQKGRLLPSFVLTHGTDEKACDIYDLLEERTIIAFFFSLCSSCNPSKRMATLARATLHYQEKGFPTKNINIFSGPFETEDIQLLMGNQIRPDDYYIAHNYLILPKEQQYITNNSLKNDPLTILVDNNGLILFVEKSDMPDDLFFELLTTYGNRNQ